MRWICFATLLCGCAPGGHTVVSRSDPQPFCTRTLGMAQCFADPAALPDHPTQLLDTPVRTHTECEPFWRNGALVCLLGQPGRP